MSTLDYRSKKLNINQALKLIRLIMRTSKSVRFTSHALEEMANDGLTTQDVLNVLESTSARINREGELKNGTYRYCLETQKIAVVVAFVSDGKGLVTITVWAKRK